MNRKRIWFFLISFILFLSQAGIALNEDLIIEGDVIDLDVERGFIETEGKVRITGPDLQIDSDYATVNMDDEEIYLKGSCFVRLDDWIIKGDEVDLKLADNIIEAWGAVEVESGDIRMVGSHVYLDQTTGEGTLKGPGTVTSGGNTFKGEQFTFNLEKDTMLVEGEAYLLADDLEATAKRISFQGGEEILLEESVEGLFGRMRVEGEKVRFILPREGEDGEGRLQVEQGRLFMPPRED